MPQPAIHSDYQNLTRKRAIIYNKYIRQYTVQGKLPSFSLGSKNGAVVRALGLLPMWPGYDSRTWRQMWRQMWVEFVVAGFSSLLREVFHRVLRFSPHLKTQHFQIPIWIQLSSTLSRASCSGDYTSTPRVIDIK